MIEIASNAVQQTDQQEVQQYQPQSVMNVTNGTASNDVQQQVVTLQVYNIYTYIDSTTINEIDLFVFFFHSTFFNRHHRKTR